MGDHVALSGLLGGSIQMFCYIATPQKDAPDSVPDKGDDEGGREVPDEQPLPPEESSP